MTRILWFGDLAPTGFGTVTMALGKALLDLGHDLRFVSANAVGDLPELFASRTYIPDEAIEKWMPGRDLLPSLLDGRAWSGGWRPEAVILMSDIYSARGLVYQSDEAEALFRSVPTLHYAPVEGRGLPPSFKKLWDTIQPVAMSRFGADEISQVTDRPTPMVYHGVDTDAFWPVSPGRPIKLGEAILTTKRDCKRYFKVDPHWQLVLRTDSNWPRKRYSSLMRAMAPVMATRPKVLLAWHTKTEGHIENLLDTRSKIEAVYGSAVARRMVTTGYHDIGLPFPKDTLNALYNAADLYVSVSAEGFGLTIAEALACGVPAVAMDYSSVPEVVGPAGVLVPIAYEYDNDYGHSWAAVNEKAFARTVAAVLDDKKLMADLGSRGPAHVRSNFQWANAALQFSELLSVKEAVAA